MKRTTLLLLAGALLVAGAGCNDYRAETVLHADGGVDRAVYQNVTTVPEAAQHPRLWKQVTFALKPEDLDRAGGWPKSLDLFPMQARDDAHTYFVAWNHFASVQDLPDTVLFKAPEGSGVPDSKLVRELTRTDLGLVEEYDWTETLTDVVTLHDMLEAREKLTEFAVPFGRDVFEEAVGGDYDPADLVRWAKTDGKEGWDDLTDAIFMAAATHKGRDRSEALKDAVRTSLARHGLKLGLGDKSQEKDGEAVKEFVISLLAEKVKKGGKPVGRDEAKKWVDELNSPEGGRFKQAIQTVVDGKYGGKAALNERTEKIQIPLLGIHGFSIGADIFRYTMTFPGPVIETNGELVGAGDKVVWRFEAAAAYPNGYAMKARSLRALDDAPKVVGRDVLSDRDALAEYADLVSGDEALTKAMRRCREAASLDPLRAYVKSEAAAAAPDGVRRAGRLLRLLQGS